MKRRDFVTSLGALFAAPKALLALQPDQWSDPSEFSPYAALQIDAGDDYTSIRNAGEYRFTKEPIYHASLAGRLANQHYMRPGDILMGESTIPAIYEGNGRWTPRFTELRWLGRKTLVDFDYGPYGGPYGNFIIDFEFRALFGDTQYTGDGWLSSAIGAIPGVVQPGDVWLGKNDELKTYVGSGHWHVLREASPYFHPDTSRAEK